MRRLPIALLIATALPLMACEVRKTEEGESTEVDVDPAPIEIGRDTKTVVVPDIDIKRDTANRDTTPR